MGARCRRCIIASTYPGITLNEESICSICLASQYPKLRKKTQSLLKNLFQQQKGKYIYDCAVAFSGGKDSTYVLYLLKKKYNLHVLAITSDDFLASEQAWENRFSVPKTLGIDHVIARYNWQLYKEAYRAVIVKSGMRPRAINIVHNLLCVKALYETLNRYKIPLFITGNSQDELELFAMWQKKLQFISTGNYVYDYWVNWRNFYIKILHEVLPKKLQSRINEFVWSEPQPDSVACRMQHVPLFQYETFSIENMMSIIQEKASWKLPTDVGGTETDSRGLQFDVCVYRKLYGNEAYAAEVSKLVRDGTITRDIALKAFLYQDESIVGEFFRDFRLSWNHLKPGKSTPFLSKALDLFLPVR